jgi:hypothetical protein
MYYTKSKDGTLAKGELHGEIYIRSVNEVRALSEEESQQIRVRDGELGFVLDEPDRTWYFATAEVASQRAWVDGIKSIMNVAENLTKASTMLMLLPRNRWKEQYLLIDPPSQRILLYKQRGSWILEVMHIKDIIICEALPRVQFPTQENTFKVSTSTSSWIFSASDPGNCFGQVGVLFRI